jgi:hypothetical protein
MSTLNIVGNFGGKKIYPKYKHFALIGLQFDAFFVLKIHRLKIEQIV